MTRSSIRRPVVSGAARLRRFVLCFCLCLASLFALSFTPSTTLAQTAKPATKKAASKSDAPLAPIKDFINKDTLAVARVNLENVDVDQLGGALDGIFKQTLSLFEFSQESETACLNEFHKTVETLQNDVTLAQKTFREEYGVSEAFVVLQTTRGEGACLIVPIQGASETQLDALKELVRDQFKLSGAVYQKRYLLASKTPLKEIGAYYQSFQPGANKTLEDFFQKHSDKLVAAYTGRLKIRPLLHSTTPTDEDAKAGRIRQYDPFANSPQAIKTLVEVFDSSFTGGSAYVDASNLSVNCTLSFTTSVNAGLFRDGLSDAIETFNNFYFKLLESSDTQARSGRFAPGSSLMRRSKEDAARYHMYQWTRDVWTGRMRRYLPAQEKENVVFNLSVQNEVQKLGINTIAVWLYTKNTDLISPLLLSSARGIEKDAELEAENPFVLTTSSRKRSGELSANPFEANIVEEETPADEANDADGANPFDENVVEGESTQAVSEESAQADASATEEEAAEAGSSENPFDAGVEEDESNGEGAENPFDAGVEEDESNGEGAENPFDAGVEEDDSNGEGAENPFDAGVEEDESNGKGAENPFDAGVEEDENK
ncbi:MAG: hypothetical protein IJU03_06625 [Thermoguttaceae bacterium]|nr:hypothetical protein [Thermoguttaceae bacterium]